MRNFLAEVFVNDLLREQIINEEYGELLLLQKKSFSRQAEKLKARSAMSVLPVRDLMRMIFMEDDR